VLRRKLEAGRASEPASEEEMATALEQYTKDNPAASSQISKTDVPGFSGNAMNVAKCVLAYGSVWRVPHAAKQTTRMEMEQWKPTSSWTEAATRHQAEQRPGFIYSFKHGEITSSVDFAKQGVGIFLTMICFALSGTGVYAVTNYAPMITKVGGAQAVSILLVFIQSIIPVVVKKIVLFEGWSSEDLIMRWTLGRVYILKMANLVVLLSQLDRMGKGGQCRTLEAGEYLYNLVITGAIISMLSNWASMYFSYRFAGATGKDKLEFDNQMVAQQYIELNYNTALVWVGFSYSPMLLLVWAVLGIAEITWTAKLLQWFCKCAEKPFQATASTKMLVMMIFLSTFAYSCCPTCLFLYAHPSILYTTVGKQELTTYCGPIVATERRYTVLVDYLLGWFPSLQEGLRYATNPAVLFGIIAILTVLVAFNNEAATMVREEATGTYMDRANSEAYLREKSIQNGILAREKAVLQEQITSLNQKVVDLETGKKNGLSQGQTPGQPDSERPAKKSVGCFG